MQVDNLIIYFFICMFILFLVIALFYPLILPNKLMELFSLNASGCEACCKNITNKNDCLHNCIAGVVCDCCYKKFGRDE